MGNSISISHNLDFYICADKYEAQHLLDNAERLDFYIEECQDDIINSLARKGKTYRANSIPLRDLNYAKAFLDGTTEYLPNRLLNDLKSITIIQLMPSADGGMPHTRPNNIICYPDILQLFSKITLIHELWHIHQRNYKDMWVTIFKRLGWTMWIGELPEILEKSRRYNPDTVDSPFWIFNDNWIPLPIFRNISQPNVADVEIWFYNPHKKYHIKRIPDEISSYFPGLPLTAYEHPREITAYLLSEPEMYKDSTGLKHLLESIGEISIITNKNEDN